MEHFNKDLLKNVTEYLNGAELCRFGRICKRFREIFIELVKHGGLCIALHRNSGDCWVLRKNLQGNELGGNLLIFYEEKHQLNALLRLIKGHKKDSIMVYKD